MWVYRIINRRYIAGQCPLQDFLTGVVTQSERWRKESARVFRLQMFEYAYFYASGARTTPVQFTGVARVSPIMQKGRKGITDSGNISENIKKSLVFWGLLREVWIKANREILTYSFLITVRAPVLKERCDPHERSPRCLTPRFLRVEGMNVFAVFRGFWWGIQWAFFWHYYKGAFSKSVFDSKKFWGMLLQRLKSSND